MPSKIISGPEILRRHFHFEWLGLLYSDLALDLCVRKEGEHQVVYIKLDFEHRASLHGQSTHFCISDQECIALFKVLVGN